MACIQIHTHLAMAKKSTFSLFFLLFTIFIILPSKSNAFFVKTPFYPRDIIPFLPREISWPILKNLHSAVDLLPAFVGAVSSTRTQSLEWKGACFHSNNAWMEFHNKTRSKFGGGTLHIKVSNAHSWTCMDMYVIATPYRVTWDYYFRSQEHTLEFEWQGETEYEHVKEHGVSIFLMQAGMLGTLEALWEVFPLFTRTGWGESSNLDFLRKHMGASFEERSQPWVTNITADEIHSGDILAISKIRGPWGGFETLVKWVTGSFAGHTAVSLRDSDGMLWVAESGRLNEKGRNVIALVPWDEWWEFEQKDDSNPHVALLPLHSDLRAKFNGSAAWEFVTSMAGKPYGYHNMMFSWIDTISENYPAQLDAHLVASFLTIWNWMQPAYSANVWKEALNKRLGTEDLDLPEILVEVEKRGSSFDQLLAIPEQDDWVYADGMSVSCVAYVISIYKAAGLFGSLSSSIHATEFTIKDAYTLRFFESNSSRLPSWCNDGDSVKLPYCQIQGRYRMELPGYNTIDPYTHMNERCPSHPPKYYRPSTC